MIITLYGLIIIVVRQKKNRSSVLRFYFMFVLIMFLSDELLHSVTLRVLLRQRKDNVAFGHRKRLSL